MKPERTLSEIRAKTKTLRTVATPAIDRFRAMLEKNPLQAFEWSSDAFEAAARWTVAEVVDGIIERLGEGGSGEGDPIVAVHHVVREAVVRGARWPSRSTSPTANEAKTCELAAYADFLAWLEGGL